MQENKLLLTDDKTGAGYLLWETEKRNPPKILEALGSKRLPFETKQGMDNFLPYCVQ